MERFGFDETREVEDEVDDLRRLEAVMRRRESIQESVSRVVDSHETRETVSREGRSITITEEEREEIIEKVIRESPLPETIENTAHLDNIERFERGLDNHPELRFRKRFNRELQDVDEYYESEDNDGIPYLVREIGKREVRRLYEEANGGLPKVEIESMDDVNRLLEKYPSEKERTNFWTQLRATEIYFEVREDQTKMQKELAEEYGISQQRVSDYQRGVETTLISYLRHHEERAILSEWVKSELLQYLENRETLEKESVAVSPEEHALHTIESSKVRERIERSLEESSIDEYVAGIKEGYRELITSESRIGYIDVSTISTDPECLKVSEIARLNREAIEANVREHIGLEPSDKSVRVGITAERVYIWRPDLTPNDMINAWGDQYFYFKTSDLARTLTEVGKQLEMGRNGYERLAHYNELVKQIVSDKNMDQITLKENATRVSGENLHLLSDMMGVSPRVYEDRIFKVASSNGQSYILNPKILNGERLEELRADFIATALSDCNLRKNGRMEYYEGDLDRIGIVIKNMNKFGEIDSTIRYRADRGSFELTFPRPMGKAALYWEIPYGDKTVLNPEMPSSIENASIVVQGKYLCGLIPEEGNVETNVVWNRSNVIDAGIKSEDYDFESKICQEEIDLIISKGRRDANDLEGKIYLRWSDIDSMRKSNTPESEIATKIAETFQANRNHLIDAEKRIAQNLGIKVRVRPATISYYEKTGRVSVKWRASTKGLENTVRWGILCPPNDVQKKELMRGILSNHQKVVSEVKKKLENEQIEFDEWW